MKQVVAKSMASYADLVQVCEATANMLTQITDWLGSATTREAAEEAMCRVRRMLQAAGFESAFNDDLAWRGVIIRALEKSGIGMGSDDEIRVRLQTDPPWKLASGPKVTEVAERAVAAIAHEVYRNHEHSPKACSGCAHAQEFLDAAAVRGKVTSGSTGCSTTQPA